ncbi:MAG: hypothetical protein NZ898_05490 [Myxococcota bacterium]|nr:hypothetical protein [Myxococcota bacterium]MDW8362366.1 hypothetical protein [Myxococcales bacterium]
MQWHALGLVGLLATAAVLAAGCGGRRRDDGPRCRPACGTFQQCCETAAGAACVSIGEDPAHCGGCGRACAAGQRCVGAMCVGTPIDAGPRDATPSGDCRPTCASSERCCGTSCVPLSVPPGTDGRSNGSFANCNGCGFACDPMRASACSVPLGMSGPPRCMCGNFNQCSTTERCVMEGTIFRCVNTSNDVSHCGEIGRRCGEGETCVMGTCRCGTGEGCGEGRACCAGSCIDVATDEAHCGRCGNACPAETTCLGGECVCGAVTTHPDAGTRDGGASAADGATTEPVPGGAGGGGESPRACRAPSAADPGEICCGGRCVPQDDSNCGACGRMCDTDDDERCIVSAGFPPGSTLVVCCGQMFPIIGGICEDGFPGLDAGAPGLDGGFP